VHAVIYSKCSPDMKTILTALMLSLVSATLFVGCEKKQEPAMPDKPEAPEAPATPDAPEAPNP